MAKLAPTKPFLLLLYGFPGAGKTYFARQLCERLQAAHVQADRIRAELFEKPRYDKQETEIVTQLMNYMVGEFLNSGTSVVYDANAMRMGQRRALRDLARRSNAQPVLIWLQIDPESALAREQKRDRRRADDKYAAELEQTDFNELTGHMQNPSAGEDYVVISGKHSFTTQYSAVARKLHELGILNLADVSAHLPKPGMVNLIPSAAGRVDMSRRNIVIR